MRSILRGNEIGLCEHVTSTYVRSQGRVVQSNLTKCLGIQAFMATWSRHVVESVTDTASYAEKDITQPFKVVFQVHRGPT